MQSIFKIIVLCHQRNYMASRLSCDNVFVQVKEDDGGAMKNITSSLACLSSQVYIQNAALEIIYISYGESASRRQQAVAF